MRSRNYVEHIWVVAFGWVLLGIPLGRTTPAQSRGTEAATTQPSFDIPDLPPEFTQIRKASETHSVRMSVEMPRVAALGSPIEVKLELINGRAECIDCNHDLDTRDFNMLLTDMDGHRVAKTDFGKINTGDPYTFTLNPGLRIDPGKRLSRRYDLTKYFRIAAPGWYSLRVLKAVASTPSFQHPGRDLEVDIDPIVFNVERK